MSPTSPTPIAANLEHLAPFMPWVSQEPLTEAARTQMVRDWESDRVAGGDALYGIWRDGRVVGAIGAHRRVARDGLEIGYWLRADEQGRGTMTRVVEGVTRALLALPGITHVEIRHDEANIPQRRDPATLWVPVRRPRGTGGRGRGGDRLGPCLADRDRSRRHDHPGPGPAP